jgi:hypothetical protein
MENSNHLISTEPNAKSLDSPFWSFTYPDQVVSDPSMDVDEKRAILAAWASDVHAVKFHPQLRYLPGTPFPVPRSSIEDAMIELEQSGPDESGPAPASIEPRPIRPICPASRAPEAV